jgi:Acyl-CoA dehydrogenase, N-terminal domain
MTFQDLFVPLRDDQFGQLRRQKPLEACRGPRPRDRQQPDGDLPIRVFSSPGAASIAKRSCDRTTGVVLDRHDCAASFPFDDYADLRTEGLLGLCVPERYDGLGADYETYCLVAEQLAPGNASTALTFNMRCLAMLMMGPIADSMPMSPTVRERHEKLRAAKFREVVEDGAFYGQPHSEPVEQGPRSAGPG